MKSLLERLFRKKAVIRSDYRQDLLVKQGREQFKRLLEKGITVPIALL